MYKYITAHRIVLVKFFQQDKLSNMTCTKILLPTTSVVGIEQWPCWPVEMTLPATSATSPVESSNRPGKTGAEGKLDSPSKLRDRLFLKSGHNK